MTELENALKLAEQLLNEPNCDPDDDLRTLSRQLLRRQEEVDRLKENCATYRNNLRRLEQELLHRRDND